MRSKILAVMAGFSAVFMLGGCAYADYRDGYAYRYYGYDGPIPRPQRFYGPPPYPPPPGAYGYGNMERELRRRFHDGRFRFHRRGAMLALDLPADVLFDLDSAEIRPEAAEAIRSVAETLKRFPGTDVDVNGYTDTSGAMEHNQDLSVARAEAVAGELARDGLAPQSIRAQGFGETGLAVPTPDGVREAHNRRVEFVFLPPQPPPPRPPR